MHRGGFLTTARLANRGLSRVIAHAGVWTRGRVVNRQTPSTGKKTKPRACEKFQIWHPRFSISFTVSALARFGDRGIRALVCRSRQILAVSSEVGGAKMSSLAKQRLAIERKSWRKDHPHGFVAKPAAMRDGSLQLLRWECKVPGKAGTHWEGGLYPVVLEFTEDYPSKPPRVAFPAGFFHPNVYPSGKVCLSILNEEKAWKPSITVKQILVGVQELLDNPNNADAAQDAAYRLYKKSGTEYAKRVRIEASKYMEASVPTMPAGGTGPVGGDDDVILL